MDDEVSHARDRISHARAVTSEELVAAVAEMADTLEHLRRWIYGTDLGYTVVAYSESNPVTVYKCVLRATRNLRTIVDSLGRRSVQ